MGASFERAKNKGEGDKLLGPILWSRSSTTSSCSKKKYSIQLYLIRAPKSSRSDYCTTLASSVEPQEEEGTRYRRVYLVRNVNSSHSEWGCSAAHSAPATKLC